MSRRNGFPGRVKMIQRLSDEAYNQFYDETGSHHKAEAESQHYVWRLEASSLTNVKKEFNAVFRKKLPIEPLRSAAQDPH